MSKLSLPIPNEASQLYQPINAQWMEIEILQLQKKQITLIFLIVRGVITVEWVFGEKFQVMG